MSTLRTLGKLLTKGSTAVDRQREGSQEEASTVEEEAARVSARQCSTAADGLAGEERSRCTSTSAGERADGMHSWSRPQTLCYLQSRGLTSFS